MNRIQRKPIALCMSFVLLIFTICQAQAMTRVVLPAADIAAAEAAMSTSMDMPAGCHEPVAAQAPWAPDCHDECQNVHQADIAKKLQLPDVMALPAVFELPVMAQTASAQSLAMLPAWADPGDPHPVIRFQRFLE
ncbi:MAG: hypothetical protein V4688_03955 [Pseudomonadota bacterium]